MYFFNQFLQEDVDLSVKIYRGFQQSFEAKKLNQKNLSYRDERLSQRDGKGKKGN